MPMPMRRRWCSASLAVAIAALLAGSMAPSRRCGTSQGVCLQLREPIAIPCLVWRREEAEKEKRRSVFSFDRRK